ncbi:MAG: energy transducer TonB [Treponema sp.]|jgi:protein TonB|nr:energy transducer TonB [Treponema sp.]
MNRSRYVFVLAICFSVFFHGAVFLLVPGIPAKPVTPAPDPELRILNLFNLDVLEPEILPPAPTPPHPAPPPPAKDNTPPEENAIPEVAVIVPDQAAANEPSLTGTSALGEPSVADIPAAFPPQWSRREDAINRYAGKVRSLIDSRKEYPYQARRQEQEGTVIVRFVLTRNGRLVGEPALERKSRYEQRFRSGSGQESPIRPSPRRCRMRK